MVTSSSLLKVGDLVSYMTVKYGRLYGTVTHVRYHDGELSVVEVDWKHYPELRMVRKEARK